MSINRSKTIVMTQTEFLLETLEYYTTDTNRRCVIKSTCKYSPVNAGKEGVSEGCAIGRHLATKLQLRLDKGTPGLSVMNNEVFSQLPKRMQKLSQQFLWQIQVLHDNGNYWDLNCLSASGRDKLTDIIIEYKLDRVLFRKYFG